jgi:hypothetical protein
MTFRDMTAAAKVTAVVLVLVSLGSCAIVQYTDQRTFTYSLEMAMDKKRCALFVRTFHVGHTEPVPPRVDTSSLNDTEVVAELALTHAENLKTYIDNERRYLAEDMRRHADTCN